MHAQAQEEPHSDTSVFLVAINVKECPCDPRAERGPSTEPEERPHKGVLSFSFEQQKAIEFLKARGW